MNAIIDSGMWIAVKHKDDQYSLQAEEILRAWQNGKIREVHLTNYVLLETTNFLLRKTSFQTALEAIKMLTESKRAKIRYVDELMHGRIMGLFRQYEELSLTDCSLLALAEEEGIKEIFSFDTAFDRVKGITRKEKLP